MSQVELFLGFPAERQFLTAKKYLPQIHDLFIQDDEEYLREYDMRFFIWGKYVVNGIIWILFLYRNHIFSWCPLVPKYPYQEDALSLFPVEFMQGDEELIVIEESELQIA